ncbi:hypothetical protein E2C01_042702 [Portunus trituberculatus]|uniref:Uncharacterized protein n=1 Tax=Portunus trituberculatus TaxID=210409 RepID=A0A5B7FTQ9_PORTR|nr:hypothetical protein [Portunus trituberculatus]
MNFFLVKHSHHLEGLPSGVLKTRSHTLRPVSCRSCWRYCCINSAIQLPTMVEETQHDSPPRQC